MEKYRPRDVGSRVIAGLLSVDDVHNEFTLDLELKIDWNEPVLKNPGHGDSVVALTALPEHVYVPKVHIPNANKCEKTLENFFVNVKTGQVFLHLNWTVTIREPLEHYRFPLDRQILKFFFESENAAFASTEADVGSWPVNWAHVSTDGVVQTAYAYSALPQWELVGVEPLESWQTGASFTLGGKLRIQRRFDYYFWNIVLPIFLLVLASLSTCFLSPAQMGERASISVTFFLALIAFKYVLTSLLPHISYLTWLDSHVLLSFVLLALGVAENVVVRLLLLHYDFDAARVQDVDYYYAGVVGSLWLLLHLAVLVLWKAGAFRKAWDGVTAGDDKGRMEVTNDDAVKVLDRQENKYTYADYASLV